MKTWKPMAVVLALMLLAGTLLTGCGGGGSDVIVGQWNATEISVNGTTLKLKDFGEMLGENNISVTLGFKEDGTVTGNVMGQSVDGTWTGGNGVYEVNMDGQSQEMTLENGKLSITIEGMTLILTK